MVSSASNSSMYDCLKPHLLHFLCVSVDLPVHASVCRPEGCRRWKSTLLELGLHCHCVHQSGWLQTFLRLFSLCLPWPCRRAGTAGTHTTESSFSMGSGDPNPCVPRAKPSELLPQPAYPFHPKCLTRYFYF